MNFYCVIIRLCIRWLQFPSPTAVLLTILSDNTLFSLFFRVSQVTEVAIFYLQIRESFAIITCDLDSKIFHWKESMYSLAAHIILSLTLFWSAVGLLVSCSFGLHGRVPSLPVRTGRNRGRTDHATLPADKHPVTRRPLESLCNDKCQCDKNKAKHKLVNSHFLGYMKFVASGYPYFLWSFFHRWNIPRRAWWLWGVKGLLTSNQFSLGF